VIQITDGAAKSCIETQNVGIISCPPAGSLLFVLLISPVSAPEIEGYAMLIRKIAYASAFAGTIAMSLWASAALAMEPVKEDAKYAPIQSIRYADRAKTACVDGFAHLGDG
jgi:hypothetical protein